MNLKANPSPVGRAATKHSPKQREKAVVVGGGIAGLSTALALAEHGIDVTVLEARTDPESAEGKALLEQSGRLLEKAEQATGDEKMEFLAQADSLRQQTWASRGRGILLDRSPESFLKKHHVDTRKLGPPELLLSPPTSKTQFAVEVSNRKTEPSDGRIDPLALVTQRDITVQTQINSVERALRDAVDKNQGIEIKFQSPSGAIKETESGVDVEYGTEGARLHSDLVIVADGGGKSSALSSLGIERKTVRRERLSTAVFKDKGEPEFEQKAAIADFNSNYSAGLFSIGDSINVNVFSDPDQEAPTALELTESWGISEPLAEMPQTYIYDWDRAEDFVSGNRVLVAGDAAVKGTAVYGLGSQFGMAFAQLVGDTVAKNGGSCRDLGPELLQDYNKEAGQLADLRLGYEGSAHQALGSARNGLAGALNFLSDWGAAASVKDLDYNFRHLRDGEGRLDLGGVLDLPAVAKKDAVMNQLFENSGPLRMKGKNLRTQMEKGQVVVSYSEERPLVLSNDLETVRFVRGKARIGVDDEGSWFLDGKDLQLERTLRKQDTTSSFEVDELRLAVPLNLMESMVGSSGGHIDKLGLLADSDLQSRFEFHSGTISIAGMELGVSEGTQTEVKVSRRPQGGVKFQAKILQGRVNPTNMGQALEQASFDLAKPAQKLRSGARTAMGMAGTMGGAIWGSMLGPGGAMLGGWLGRKAARKTSDLVSDAYMATAGKIGAALIKEIDIDLLPDNSALIDMHLPGIPSMRIPRKDVAQLQEQILAFSRFDLTNLQGPIKSAQIKKIPRESH